MAAEGASSLESRISQPENTGSGSSENSEHSNNANKITTSWDSDTKDATKPSSSSWADDFSSPIQSKPPTQSEGPSTQPSKSAMHQTDGAAETQNGSAGVIEPEFDVTVKLADAQADPTNPLYSIKTFEQLGLDEAILKGIYQMRFMKPSKIQERALPLLLSDPPTNMIGQSQSGTGKTAAFVLNILSRIELKDPEMSGVPQALILAPTRELARQIIGVIQLMGSFIEGLRVLPAIPMDIANRGKSLQGQVVVGTPGTTMDLIRRRLLSPNRIKVLVLDEADNMLDLQGLGDQCIRVKQMLPNNVQKVLFSATFPDNVIAYAGVFAPDANQITLRHDELTVEGIKQLYLDCHDEQTKFEVLLKLYGLMTIGSSIIFVKTRITANEIEERMTASGHKVASLTGAFEGHERDTIIDRFRSGQAKVLIATNVLARGIDVQTVSLVVNYDIPMTGHGTPDTETYLHRIGRTGRFGRVGVSISLIHNRESWLALRHIGDFFGVPLTGIDTSDWDAVETAVKKVIKSSRKEAAAEENM
ncbi:RNA helicase required for poly(A+) mRNA export [Lobaria immixta]|nr:RNA helicase required for poly(A+) mRNA export [Lobaria immixta]